MNFSNAFGIEYRVVKNAEHQGVPVRIVGGSRTYKADIDELWDAVTNGERLARWFAPVSGELQLGGRYQIKGNAGGEVTRCDQPTALDLTWEYGGNVSWVTVRFESVADGTKLTLEHMMGKDEVSEGHWKKYGPGATGVGWELGFLGLGLYLDNPDDEITAESEKWLGTADGKSFIKESAFGWGEAHVASGEDRATAEASARETATAYSGENVEC